MVNALPLIFSLYATHIPTNLNAQDSVKLKGFACLRFMEAQLTQISSPSNGKEAALTAQSIHGMILTIGRCYDYPSPGRWLNDESKSWPVDETFLASLNEDASALHDIALTEANSRENAQLLDAITLDLAVKAEHVLIVKGATAVKLNFNSMKNGRHAPGCEVVYVLAGWRNHPNLFTSLPSQTDTLASLSPGRYVLWTKKAGRTGPQKPISLVGEDLVNVTLEAP